MSNNKDLIIKNQLQIGASVDVGVGTITQSAVTKYSLEAASYNGKCFKINESTITHNLTFKPDGTKMYVVERSNDSVYQYSLSTAYDVVTASYDNKSFSFATQETEPYGIAFNDDGTSMYTIGYGSDAVYQYTLTTAYDVSTASYASKSLSVSSEDTLPTNVTFKPDGTSLYVIGASSDAVYQYNLTTAFDVSTGSYASKSLDISSQDTNANGFAFNADGTKCFVQGNNSDKVHQYSLTTAYDISTASYDDVSFDLSSIDTNPFGLAFSNDGSRMYVLGSDDFVYQFDTVQYPIDTSFDLGGATYDSVTNGTTISTNDNDSRKLFFKPDGTKVFVIGNGSGKIWEYPMTTPWDISTMGTSTANLDLTTYAANVRGGFFKPDGTRFYSGHLTNDTVGEWILSTPWDVSTMAFQTPIADYEIELTDVGSLEDIEFSSDGTKLIVADLSTNPKIKSFTLSTAWDVTTATYDGDSASFDFTTYSSSNPHGIRFNSDGTVLYVVLNSPGAIVIAYSLSTAYDVSTITGAVYDSRDFADQNADVSAIDFDTDGLKLFMLGRSGNDTIYQYTSGTRKNVETLDLSTGNFFQKSLETDTKFAFSNSSTVQTFNLELTGSDSVTGGYQPQDADYPYLPTNYFNGIRKVVTDGGNSLYGINVSTDGYRMYILSQNNQDVAQYNLEFPFNIATASYSGTEFSLSSQSSTGFTDIFFKPDGTAFYAVTGSTPDSVYQYTLGTAWELSTASYASKSFSIQTQETQPQTLAFDPYGRFLYVAGSSNDTVYRYSLSTEWDVSTASYDGISFSVSSQTGNPSGVRFSYDGAKMYISNGGSPTSSNIFIYTLSEPWNPSTATYDSSTYRISQNSNGTTYPNLDDLTTVCRSFFITQDGTKMWMLSSSTYAIQYNIGTLETVTWPTSVKWVNGLQPPNPSPGQKDLYTFSTKDGGTTYWGQRVESNIG